jgi:glucokinase
MAATLRLAAEAADTSPAALLGVGIGAPGAVDRKAGTLARAPNLSNWLDPYPLASVLSDALGTPVHLGNDVGVAVDAELRLGAGRPYQSFAGVFWGTGVGGGVVLDGKVRRGRGAGGEIGHVKVEQRDGLPCGCGSRGCMEAYAGRGNMERRAREAVAAGRETRLFEIMAERNRTRLASGVWAQALAEGDVLAAELLDEALEAIATAAASVVNLLDVEAVILGGGLGLRLGAPWADRLLESMRPRLFQPARPPDVVVAELGDLGGAIGAALLVNT